MSGGTWGYDQFKVSDLADRIRSGDTRWGQDEPLDLAWARAYIADVLDTAAALVKELDWCLAGDTTIDDEGMWVARAWARLAGIPTAQTEPLTCVRCGRHLPCRHCPEETE